MTEEQKAAMQVEWDAKIAQVDGEIRELARAAYGALLWGSYDPAADQFSLLRHAVQELTRREYRRRAEAVPPSRTDPVETVDAAQTRALAVRVEDEHQALSKLRLDLQVLGRRIQRLEEQAKWAAKYGPVRWDAKSVEVERKGPAEDLPLPEPTAPEPAPAVERQDQDLPPTSRPTTSEEFAEIIRRVDAGEVVF